MMLKPSIDTLLDKVPSKYSLVILEAKRAHELEKIAKFVGYEKMYNRKTQIECKNPVLQSLVCQYLDKW